MKWGYEWVALKNKSDEVAHRAGARYVPVSMAPPGSITQQLFKRPFYRFENWDRKGRCIWVKIRGELATHRGCKRDSGVESRPRAWGLARERNLFQQQPTAGHGSTGSGSAPTPRGEWPSPGPRGRGHPGAITPGFPWAAFSRSSGRVALDTEPWSDPGAQTAAWL